MRDGRSLLCLIIACHDSFLSGEGERVRGYEPFILLAALKIRWGRLLQRIYILCCRGQINLQQITVQIKQFVCVNGKASGLNPSYHHHHHLPNLCLIEYSPNFMQNTIHKLKHTERERQRQSRRHRLRERESRHVFVCDTMRCAEIYADCVLHGIALIWK